MHSAHRRPEAPSPRPVQLAKLTVLIRLQAVSSRRDRLLVLGPQQLHRCGALVQFVVHVRVVDGRAPVLKGLSARVSMGAAHFGLIAFMALGMWFASQPLAALRGHEELMTVGVTFLFGFSEILTSNVRSR